MHVDGLAHRLTDGIGLTVAMQAMNMLGGRDRHRGSERGGRGRDSGPGPRIGWLARTRGLAVDVAHHAQLRWIRSVRLPPWLLVVRKHSGDHGSQRVEILKAHLFAGPHPLHDAAEASMAGA